MLITVQRKRQVGINHRFDFWHNVSPFYKWEAHQIPHADACKRLDLYGLHDSKDLPGSRVRWENQISPDDDSRGVDCFHYEITKH